MAQVTSGKTARCDWLLTWQDFSVMTARIMKIVNALWTKTNSKSWKLILKKTFSSLKLNKILKWATKNIQTVNFIILKSKKSQREKLVAVVAILTKLKQAEMPDEKLVPIVLIFVIKSAM